MPLPKRPSRFFGSLNDFRSSEIRTRFIDPRQGRGDAATRNTITTITNRYTRNSLERQGNIFEAEVLAVQAGIPAANLYPQLHASSNATMPDLPGGEDTRIIPEYFLFFLQMEIDSFLPDASLIEDPGSRAKLMSSKGRAISRTPAAEFGPVGAGDIVRVYLPHQNSYNGAEVVGVSVRNSMEPIVVEPDPSQYFGTPLGAALAVTSQFVGGYSPNGVTAFTPGAPLQQTGVPWSIDNPTPRQQELYAERMRELLQFHGVTTLEEFQAQAGLTANGVLDARTAWDLQLPWAQANVLGQGNPVIGASEGPDAFPRFAKRGRGLDQEHWGYPQYTAIRSDMSQVLARAYNQILERGGFISSSGSRRAIGARTLASGAPSVSMHCVGMAFDLCIHDGMQKVAENVGGRLEANENTDAYLVVFESGTDTQPRWRIYANLLANFKEGRVRGSSEAPLNPRTGLPWLRAEVITQADQRTLENVAISPKYRHLVPGWPPGTEFATVHGFFLDMTRIFMDHGFSRIRAHRDWRTNFLGIEWWHFQSDDHLVPGLSQFGIEAIRYKYSLDDLGRLGMFGRHQSAYKIFGRNWY